LTEDAYASLSHEQPADSAERRKHTQVVNLLLGLVRRRLLDSALKEQDAELAQRIIDHYVPGGDSEALAKLASTGNLPARVIGRSVGLILELGDTRGSQRSAQVALGLSATLDLFAPGAAETTLRTRTAEDPAGVALAFQQLISDGAAVIVAGMGETSAATLAQLAEQMHMPTLLATRQAEANAKSRWVFTIGESDQRVAALLTKWSTDHGLPAQLIAADDPRCAFEGAAVGKASFPVSDWQTKRVPSLLVLGDQACASLLLEELKRTKYSPVVLLGLDTAHLIGNAPRTATLKAGAFPERTKPSVTGAPYSWYYSIGHDAALWSMQATRDFEAVMTNQPDEIELLHGKVATSLRSEQVENLWTTDARTFSDAAILERKLDVVTSGLP
jgi:hypothetical protein